MADKEEYWKNRHNTIEVEKKIKTKKGKTKTVKVIIPKPLRGQGPNKPPVQSGEPGKHLIMVGSKPMLVNRKAARQRIPSDPKYTKVRRVK